MKKAVKFLLWVVVFVVAFGASFGIFFKVGIDVISNRFYKPLEVKWTKDSGEILTDISFGDWEDTCYDLYIPSGLDKTKEQTLIYFIHGGGFTSGDKSDNDKWCKFFATKGYITATPNYTLMTEKTTSNINLIDEQLVACVKDIIKVCGERGYTFKQMATSGFSAGGCLALLYGYKHTNDSDLIPVKFVFEQSGPATFIPTEWGAAEDDYEAQIESATKMSGKTVTIDMIKDGSAQSIIDEISPASYVNENTIPTLCGYGPKDKIVPVGLKDVLFAQFKKYNVKYDYILFPNSGHGLLGDPDKQEEYVKLALKYCDEYFD